MYQCTYICVIYLCIPWQRARRRDVIIHKRATCTGIHLNNSCRAFVARGAASSCLSTAYEWVRNYGIYVNAAGVGLMLLLKHQDSKWEERLKDILKEQSASSQRTCCCCCKVQEAQPCPGL